MRVNFSYASYSWLSLWINNNNNLNLSVFTLKYKLLILFIPSKCKNSMSCARAVQLVAREPNPVQSSARFYLHILLNESECNKMFNASNLFDISAVFIGKNCHTGKLSAVCTFCFHILNLKVQYYVFPRPICQFYTKIKITVTFSCY